MSFTDTSVILINLIYLSAENKYQEAACKAQIAALQECCKKWFKVSGCCAGVKIEDTTATPDSTSQPKVKDLKYFFIYILICLTYISIYFCMCVIAYCLMLNKSRLTGRNQQ